jgi:ADP-ribosylglycohydrolase
MTHPDTDRMDRAMGALTGAALGDAMGMPTQIMSRAAIAQAYGNVVAFIDPTPDHPVSRGLAAGTVTDDTEQMMLLGALLADGGTFDQRRWVETLVGWEDEIIARGSHDLLGPSTKRAIAAVRAGVDPAEAGRTGDTNGAAMRIAPVGILMPPQPLDRLVDKVAETCLATHNTGLAIASAAAVAAAVSSAIDGAGWREAAETAVAAARSGERRGNWVAGASIAARIEWALNMAQDTPDERRALTLVADLLGTSVAAQESVPAAFAVLAIADGEPWRAAVLAANLGGDTDTIGAIAGAVAGAVRGYGALPADKVRALRGFDREEARALAERLLLLRHRAVDAPAGGKDAA